MDFHKGFPSVPCKKAEERDLPFLRGPQAKKRGPSIRAGPASHAQRAPSNASISARNALP